MKGPTLVIAFALGSAATSGMVAESQGARQVGRPPGIGDQAPPFDLRGSDGRTYRLSDYRGKQVVVLAWFARAFSGG